MKVRRRRVERGGAGGKAAGLRACLRSPGISVESFEEMSCPGAGRCSRDREKRIDQARDSEKILTLLQKYSYNKTFL